MAVAAATAAASLGWNANPPTSSLGGFAFHVKTDQFFAEARPLVFGRLGFFEFFFAIQSLGQNFWPTDWTAIFFAIQSLGQDFWPADSTIENEKKLIENERI